MQQVPGLTDEQRAALSTCELDEPSVHFFESLSPERQFKLRTRVLELVEARVQLDCVRFVKAGTLSNKAWKRAIVEWRPS